MFMIFLMLDDYYPHFLYVTILVNLVIIFAQNNPHLLV